MVFFTVDFNNPEVEARFLFEDNPHNATWDFYCDSYSYTIRKILQKGLNGNYVLNCKAKSILFLIRHYFELCIKRNLVLNGQRVLSTHNLVDLLDSFENKDLIPTGFKELAEQLNYDGTGECFRYDKNNGGTQFFDNRERIELGCLLRRYLAIEGNENFKIDAISDDFTNNRQTNWSLTFHLSEASRLGQIRTQYDFIVGDILKGIENGEYDLNKAYLPLFFLIRHSMEIGLKANLYDINITLGRKHSIKTLYNCFCGDNGYVRKLNKQVSTSTQQTINDYIEKLRELKGIMHQMDVNSYVFRFPVDGSRKPHILSISEKTLLTVIKLYLVTDAFITFTNQVLRDEGVLPVEEEFI